MLLYFQVRSFLVGLDNKLLIPELPLKGVMSFERNGWELRGRL